MAGSALNLSLLSRGIGEVTKNGHEKVDVVLEPEDYYNYTITGASTNFKLPPIEPKPAFEESPREVPLPKTFTTRKGALLLFSEDFALKARAAEREQDIRDGKAVATSFDDLDLRTVDDLTRSILTYGSGRGELHLRFVRNYAIPRKFRPGFSARRYLSRLTRSFDDSFLNNLMSKGFVQEKTLYQYNALLPKLKRRINDDISVMPAPYRIMKQMLMAPGLLSGYSFYTGRQDTVSSDLTIVLEESEADDGQASRQASGIKVVEVRDGEARRVSYNELTKEDKENVLADLLVKSAINHALEKQKQKLEDEPAAAPVGDQAAVRTRLSSLQSSEAAELDMAEAVRSYLESKVDKESVANADTARSGSLKGSKVSSHSAKSFEGDAPLPPIARPIVLPDTVGDREYVGGVPVVSVKDTVSDTASVTSLASSHTSRDVGKPASQPAEPPTALSPIKDEGSFVQSRETTFSQTPVLPPIRPVVQTLGEPVADKDDQPASGVPQVNIQPPTPQHSTLTAAGTSPKPVSREPTVRAMAEESESEEDGEPEKEWKGDISEEEILEKQEEEDVKKKRELSKKGSTQSLLSAVSVDSARGPVLGAGSPLLSSTESIGGDQLGNSLQSFGSMKGHALRATKPTKSQPKARKSPKKDSETSSSKKGSVIVGPGGAVLSVGGAISGTSEPSIDAVSEANKTPRDPVDAQSETAAHVSEDEDEKKSWPAQGHLSARSKASKISAKSGYNKTHKTREIDPTSGDFNATLGVSSWSYNQPRNVDKSSESGASQTQSSKHPHSLDQSETGDTDRRSPFPEEISEQELVEALTDHAHKIASSILTKPGTGEDLAEDAQAAAFMWLDRKSDISRSQSEQNLASHDAVLDHFFAERGGVKSAAPSTAEYRELLKETLSNALSKLANTGVEFPPDAEVSPELIEALAKQGLSADDIEVIVGEDGKTIITVKEGKRPADQTGAPSRGQVKEGHTYQQPQKGGSDSPTEGATQQGLPISIPTGRLREADIGEPAVIHYGEGQDKPSQGSPDAAAETADGKKSRASSLKVSEPGSPTRVSSVAKSAAGKSTVSFKDEEGEGETKTEEDEKQFLESLAQEADKLSAGKPSVKSGKSVKSTKSSKSLAKSEKSRSSLKSPESDKEEFVVGKVPDKHELSNLYGRTEEPPAKPKEKKPRVPPAKAKKTKAGKKKGKGKETSKEDAKKAKHAEKHATPTSQKELSPMPPDDKSLSPAPSGTVSEARSKEEEEMEFIFVDDEFPDGASSVSAKSLKSAKSGLRSGAVTQFTEGTEMDEDSEGSSPSNLVSNKDARAAKRAARAAKKREEVERKRKEREEQLRRERDEAERREAMQRDLEEERRRKEEERRLKREREEEERRLADEAEAARERRARMEMEREKRMKEEYQRKLEILRRQQQEEERIRREIEEKMRLEEEERLRLEQLMLSKMKAEEREEYERRKKLEEEDKLRRAELERLKLEEESRLAMEEARRVAAEMARQQAEYERRLQFNRMLQLEAEGMDTHSLNITEAFTFSYYELLKWLGMDLPEFDHLKMDRKY